ncbi:MAG: peptidoglycan-binding protein [Gammaproteobacteria bacterium]
MAIYRLGSSGAQVQAIQRRLAQLGWYTGALDGRFGGGTLAAVVAFQKDRRLDADGIVGPITWKALFKRRPPAPEFSAQDLGRRCLALSGAFETGEPPPQCFAGLSGDFDGQGLSFGVLQWNVGQRSLQPLMARMLARHRAVVQGIFHDYTAVLQAALAAPQDEQMQFVRRIQHPVKHTVNEPWRGLLRALGRTPEFQVIQAEAAARLLQAARRDCGAYGVRSQRALALMFDIRVQNGSIGAVTRAQILADFGAGRDDPDPAQAEVRRLRIIANRRAEAANPRWVEDVRARKLCIAEGEGTVHGIAYDLRAQFGIGLEPA